MPLASRLKVTATPLLYLMFACIIGSWGSSSAAVMPPEAPLPQEVGQDWWGSAQSDIAASEYNITVQNDGLQAPNRGQNLRTWFDEAGAVSVIRTAASVESAPWQWGLTLARYGWKDGAMLDAAPAQPQPKDNTVTYQRGDSLREWYVNGPDGVRSWFELKEQPAGPGDTLRLELGFRGNTVPGMADGGEGIKFSTSDGVRVINYGGLKAWDANGLQLACSLGLDGKRVVLDIEAANAVFPVTIDPLATASAWTAEINQANARFGYSVASAGDVNGDGYSDVIIGALYFDSGHPGEGGAFVYMGSASGLASTAAWSAGSDQGSSGFGMSVASAGDINGDGYSDVIVGALAFDNGQTDEGKAYVYLGSASGLASTAAWTAESDQVGARFGVSVASAGDVNGDGFSDVIVGAHNFDNGETDEGRAFVYLGSALGLASAAAWTAESHQTNAQFGCSVASAGDINGDGFSDVVVGASGFDNGQTDEGRAYVYMGSATGLASIAAWTAESDQANARFGASVASAGDVNGDGYSDVIVGADGSSNGEAEEGKAFVYRGSASGLAAVATWTAETNHADARFGISVASAGDVNGDGYSDVIVGAFRFDNSQPNEGRAYVYFGSASGLGADAAWTADGIQHSAEFGNSVASAGDVNGDGYSDVIVGAPLFDNGQANEGQAYVYLGSTSGLATSAVWTTESDQGGAYYGISVASAGDVNGDGYADVIVGAQEYDNGQTNEGRAFVYLGSPSGVAPTAAWMAEGNQDNAWFGISVASAGDVNGDGFSDVVVGALGLANQGFGGAIVYYGSATGLASAPAWIAQGPELFSAFGTSVASAGDVNGDGYSDVIVGAPEVTIGQNREGAAYLYLGSASGLGLTHSWFVESNTINARFGTSVASAGDINGDGYSDVIVGAQYYYDGIDVSGRASIYMGSASGLTPTAAKHIDGGPGSGSFGHSVASAGDVNGDGYSDVIVGAAGTSNGQNNEGRAYVHLGSASGLASTAAWTVESNKAEANFAYSVASAGDVNGDGYSDVIVGAFGFSNGATVDGRVFMYLGSASGLASTAAWTVGGEQNAMLGACVASAGDVNGDGYSDVIVGAPYFFTGPLGKGRAYIYLGYGPPADTLVVINEFMNDPEGDDNGERSEWIELYNNGPTSVDLSGYKVQGKNTGTPTISTLPAGTIIGPDDYLILAGHKVSFARGKYQRIDESKVVDLGWPYVSEMDNSAGRISITRPTESLPYISVNYSQNAPWPGPLNSDQTFELKAPNLNPGLGSNWALSSAVTAGSPLRPNAPLNTTNIAITGGKRNIQYPGTTSTVTVSASITASAAPASIDLMVDTGSGYVAIPMTNTSGTSYSATIPQVASGTLVKHYVKVTAADGYYKTQPYYRPEVFFVDNNFPGAADLTITEIMYNPAGSDNGDHSEWIEIFNRRSTPIDLSYFLWGNHTEAIDNRVMPEGTVIPANGFLILAGQKRLFTAQYPAIPASLVVDAEWTSPSSRLTEDADGTRPVPLVHTNAVDWNNTRVAFDQAPYAVSSPWPAVGDGESIQLIMTTLDGNQMGANWISAGAGNETPAAATTASHVNDWSLYQ